MALRQRGATDVDGETRRHEGPRLVAVPSFSAGFESVVRDYCFVNVNSTVVAPLIVNVVSDVAVAV